MHQPWQAGQYVTYVLEYDNGGWVAFALYLLGKENDGDWILRGDFKTPLGEGSIWFRGAPNPPPNEPDIVPVQTETIRTVPTDLDEMHRIGQDPTMMATLPMNLLRVRRAPTVRESFVRPPLSVAYPCGIDQVYPFTTPGPGYLKHHHLNPKVTLTGVARLILDDGRNPMTATSFGRVAPYDQEPVYEDFVDLSHLTSIEHDGFLLTYPATWFLRAQSREEKPDAGSQDYFFQIGGKSCIATLSVQLKRGSADDLAQQREAKLSLYSGPIDLDRGRLSPRQEVRLQMDGNAQGFVLDMDDPGITGFTYAGVYCTDAGDRFAHINVFGCIAKQHSYCTTTLAEMESAFRTILESFRFV